MHVRSGSTVAGAPAVKRKCKVRGEFKPLSVFILVNAIPVCQPARDTLILFICSLSFARSELGALICSLGSCMITV